MNIQQLIRPNILRLKGYSSARDEMDSSAEVYLDANENPFNNGVNRYPDPYQLKLKKRIGEIKSVPIANQLLGNGSDEVLDLVFRAFCEPGVDNVIITPPTYGMYKVLADTNNVAYQSVLLKEDFSLSAEEVLNQVNDNTKVIFLCSPNNPTGNIIPSDQIEMLLRKSGCIVVIDEAYIDFSQESSWSERLDEFENLIVCQTLSKAWGMAAIRLGMCFASEGIIEVLNRIKPPYNVNELTQLKAIELLEGESTYQEQKNTLIREKEQMELALSKLTIVQKIYPSEANFLLVKVDDANELYNQLIKRGVVVRNRTNEPRCENCIRISIGKPEENERLIKELKQLENEESAIYR